MLPRTTTTRTVAVDESGDQQARGYSTATHEGVRRGRTCGNGTKHKRRGVEPTQTHQQPDASPETAPVLKGGMPRTLGVRITSLKRRKIIGEMAIKPLHLNLNGNVNGGAIMAFADVLGAAGASANRAPGYRGGTIESKTNFFAAGKGRVTAGVCAENIGRNDGVETTIQSDGFVVRWCADADAVPASRNGE